MDTVKNLCQGRGVIEVTSGCFVGENYKCPGCVGCQPEKVKKILNTNTKQEEEQEELSFGGWQDTFPS